MKEGLPLSGSEEWEQPFPFSWRAEDVLSCPLGTGKSLVVPQPVNRRDTGEEGRYGSTVTLDAVMALCTA